MIRSAAFLISVLSNVAPGFQPRAAAAEALRDLGARHRFDPLTLVAIVEGESAWRPAIVSKDGRDFGLSQVRSTNFKSCRESRTSEQCQAIERVLLEWKFNLDFAAILIWENRERCERVVGSGLAKFWLQAFQGYDSTRGTTCGHRRVGKRWVAGPIPELTRKVLARRKALETMHKEPRR